MSSNLPMQNRYFILNKPFNMVSQFISPDDVRLLGDIQFDFPEGTHAIGRLDNESEGLLILTTNQKFTRLLYKYKARHTRTYLVMVQNEVSAETLKQLQEGVSIPIKEGALYTAVPVAVEIVKEPVLLCKQATDRREAYPHTWLLITLTEGKFRQVRKMVFAVRHKCLRLIRLSIENIQLDDLEPGNVREIGEENCFNLLGIQP